MTANRVERVELIDGGVSAPQDASRRAYAWGVALIVALVIGLIALAAWQEKERYREHADVATHNLAQLLAQTLVASFDKVDVALISLAGSYREQAQRGRIDPESLNTQLAQMESALPEVVSLRMTDKDGIVRFGQGVANAAATNLGDRDIFIRARDDRLAGLVVSGPLFARISKEWVIVLARRLTAADGSFAGVVYANLGMAHFNRVFSSVDLGDHGTAVLRTADLRLVHRVPRSNSPVGSQEMSAQLHESIARQPQAGDYSTSPGSDGVKRSGAYRRVGGYPFYVIVGLASEDFLSGWKPNARLLYALVGLVVLLTCLGALLVHRAHQRLAAEVAERTKQRAMLAAALDEANDLYDHAPCGYHSLGRDGRYLKINATELAWLGCRRDEVIGKMKPEDFLSPASRSLLERLRARPEADEFYDAHDLELIGRNGQSRQISLSTKVMKSAVGRFETSRSVMFDITRFRQLRDHLQETLAERNVMLNNDLVGITTVRNGVILWANMALERMLAYEPGELAGLHARQCYAGELAYRDLAAAATRVIASGASFKTQLAYLRKDGVDGWFNVFGAMLDPASGTSIWYLVDVTDRQRAEEALLRYQSSLEEQVAERTADLAAAKQEAERANVAKSRFLAAASHDLRQPLSALSLYVGALANEKSEGDAELALNMQNCVLSLSRLLTELLDLSKLDAEVVKPNVDDFALGAIIANVISSEHPEAQRKGLVLRQVCQIRIGRTDGVLFQRILENFVSNAIRYTQRGGVLIGCRRWRGKTWVEVWDTGIGIAPHQTEEIFEEYRQLGNPERNGAKGTGLGLAIAAKTAALLGIEIRVRSRPGRGSMFAVELPLGESVSPVARCAYAHRPLCIGLVEDNTDVATALAFALTQIGHEVHVADSSARLLARLASRAPDILISDYRLAGDETGLDVVAQVRSRFGDDLPALIITGDTDPDVIRKIAAQGIRVQHKPLAIDQLRACIAQCVASGGAAPARRSGLATVLRP